MTDLEKWGQSDLLAPFVRGEMFEDPRTSPLYKGLREEMMAEQDKGVRQLRRRANLGGGLFSTPAARTEADYTAQMGRGRESLLGGLYESERQMNSPQARLGALSQYGGMPREIEQAQRDAQYDAIMKRLMSKLQVGGSLANLPPIAQDQPQTYIHQLPYEQSGGGSSAGGFMGALGGGLGAYGMIASNPLLGGIGAGLYGLSSLFG